MTKKSHGRQARDKFKKSNTAWDDLREQYLASQSKLNAISSSITAFFGIKDIASFIPPQQADYVVGVVSGLASDVKLFQTRLNAIYAKHSDKFGMIDMTDGADPSEYVRLIALHNEYIDYFKDDSTILDPLYKQALGVIATIEQRVAALAEAEEVATEPQSAPAQETEQ